MRQKWERENSIDNLTNEQFIQFAGVEDYVKQQLLDCQFKFQLDYPPDKP